VSCSLPAALRLRPDVSVSLQHQPLPLCIRSRGDLFTCSLTNEMSINSAFWLPPANVSFLVAFSCLHQLPPCDSGDVRAHVQYGAAIFTPLSYEGQRAMLLQSPLHATLFSLTHKPFSFSLITRNPSRRHRSRRSTHHVLRALMPRLAPPLDPHTAPSLPPLSIGL
jgi:hypothetical protein